MANAAPIKTTPINGAHLTVRLEAGSPLELARMHRGAGAGPVTSKPAPDAVFALTVAVVACLLALLVALL